MIIILLLNFFQVEEVLDHRDTLRNIAESNGTNNQMDMEESVDESAFYPRDQSSMHDNQFFEDRSEENRPNQNLSLESQITHQSTADSSDVQSIESGKNIQLKRKWMTAKANLKIAKCKIKKLEEEISEIKAFNFQLQQQLQQQLLKNNAGKSVVVRFDSYKMFLYLNLKTILDFHFINKNTRT